MEPIHEDEVLSASPFTRTESAIGTLNRTESTLSVMGVTDADAEATLHLTIHGAKDLLPKDLNGYASTLPLYTCR